GSARPSGMEQRSAICDQCGAVRPQGPVAPTDRRDPAHAHEGRMDRRARGGRRSVRADPRAARDSRARADGGPRHAPARAGRRHLARRAAAVVRWRASDDTTGSAEDRRAQRRRRGEARTPMKVIYDVKDRIARITINRPEAMNAMDPEVYELLSKTWIDVRDNPDVWVAVITGAGDKAFTAGADLKTMIPRTRKRADFFLTQSNMILNRGLEVWKPVVAAGNGYCLAGGMTLLFATDIRIAAEHAVFEISEVKRGILPGNGGTQRALRQLPYAIAMELLLLGRRLTAQEALACGLVNKVVSAKDLLATAEQY